jgi:hypothetical protein
LLLSHHLEHGKHQQASLPLIIWWWLEAVVEDMDLVALQVEQEVLVAY